MSKRHRGRAAMGAGGMMGIGPDVRYRESAAAGETSWEPDLDERVEQAIASIHCRLLEQATAGRLTWDGDRIVPGPAATRRRPIEVAGLIKAKAAKREHRPAAAGGVSK